MARREFKFLVEGVQDYAIYLLDLSGRVTTWNVGAERIKGYRPEEIIGRHFSIFYPAEDVTAGKPEELLRDTVEHSHSDTEGWRIRKDGSRFWASVATDVLRDAQGNVRGFAKVIRDMTRKRAAELELKETLAHMQAMMEVALDCIITIDASGRITDWNPAAERTFGYARAEVIGKEMAALIIPQELRAPHRAGLARFLDKGVGPILGKRIEMRALTKEGKEIDFELAVATLPVGSSTTFTGFIRDMTARKQVEIDNARLFRQAQEAIRARDEFLQVASHELKTPLTPLQMQLDSLIRGFEKSGQKNEHLVAKLGVATRQTARLGRLVEALLDVSRITAGRIELDLEKCDLTLLVRDVAERFKSEAMKTGSPIKVSANGPLVGRWDALRVEQIVSNLVSDAIKYGSRKPIEIDLRETDDTVRVAGWSRSARWSVRRWELSSFGSRSATPTSSCSLAIAHRICLASAKRSASRKLESRDCPRRSIPPPAIGPASPSRC
jgi:PAS domain S-box-containing protein